MSPTLLKWRIYCNTESTWTYGWLEESHGPPVKCFNDTTHDVNLQSSLIIDSKYDMEVSVLEERIKTQGNFRSQGFKFEIPAVPLYKKIVDLPYHINLFNMSYEVNTENLGDVMEGFYEPGYIGSITADVSPSSTVIPVDGLTISLINIGYILKLIRVSDNHTEELGEILNIDKINNTLTVEVPTTQDFIIGDNLGILVNGFKDIYLQLLGRFKMGDTKIGGTYVESNGKLYLDYYNNNSTAKSFYFVFDYLY